MSTDVINRSLKSLRPVPKAWAKKAWCDDAKYKEMYRRSVEDPDGFWDEQIGRASCRERV